MPLREFTDAARRVWQVWDTVPKTSIDDHVFARNAELLADVERRRDEERAPGAAGHQVSHASAAAVLRRFTEGREHGWLTFMSGDEKRRLSPIPAGWDAMDDGRLAALLAKAERVQVSASGARV